MTLLGASSRNSPASCGCGKSCPSAAGTVAASQPSARIRSVTRSTHREPPAAGTLRRGMTGGSINKKLSQNQLALLMYRHRRPKPLDSRLRGNDGLGAALRFEIVSKGWEEANVSNRGALTPGDAHFVFPAKAGTGIQTIVRSRMVNAAHQTVRGFLPTQERRGGRGEGGEVDAKGIIKAPGTTLQGPRPGRNFGGNAHAWQNAV